MPTFHRRRTSSRLPSLSRIIGVLAGLALVGIGSDALHAQLPVAQLTSIFPAGGKQTTTFDVTLTGADLDDVAALRFSHPGITAVQKTGANNRFELTPHPLPLRFSVTIASDVPRGPYEVRAIGRYGISNPRIFVVGSLAEVVDTEPGHSAATAKEVPLESTINGRAGPERVDFFKFTAKQGARVLIDCWARRIDSDLDPALVLRDAAGRELPVGKERSHRDPFYDFTVPADGSYFLSIRDFLYKGGENYFYRLSLSTGPFIDFVMPPAGLPGSNGKYTLFGRNLPGRVPSGYTTSGGASLDKLDVEIPLPADPRAAARLPLTSLVEPDETSLDAFAYRLTTPQGESNPVNIFFATAPIVLEHEPNDTPAQAQKIIPPCEVVGQFNPRGDQDWYTFDAKRGDAYRIEVYSERMGLPTDPYLLVQRVKHADKQPEQVSDVAEVDDPKPEPKHERPETFFNPLGDDPSLRFVAPEDGTYRVLVRDLNFESRGSPRFVYRLAIRPEQPDFRLVVVSAAPIDLQNLTQVRLWSPLLQKGDSTGLTVVALRRDNFTGPIELSVEGLPAGITCPNMTIGPGAEFGTLVFTAADNAPAWSGAVRVIGRAKVGETELVRDARPATIVWGISNREQEVLRYRMSSEIALAVSAGETAVAKVEVGEGKAWETAVAGRLQIPVKIIRRGDYKGNVRLVAAGLPPELKIPDLVVPEGTSEAKLQVEVHRAVPAGTYTIPFRVATQVNYRRNPEGAASATQAAKEMEKLAGDLAVAARQANDVKAATAKAADDAQAAARQAADNLTNARRNVAETSACLKQVADAKPTAEGAAVAAAIHAKAAAEARTAAEQVALHATAAETQARDALMAAAKTMSDASAVLQAANERLTVARQSAEKKPDDETLKAAASAAEKAAGDAAQAVKLATDAKASAEQTSAAAETKVKTAAEAKIAAEQAAIEAAAKSAQADSQRFAAEKAFTDADAAAHAAATAQAAAEQSATESASRAQVAAEARSAAEAAANDAANTSNQAQAEKQARLERAKQANDAAQPKTVNVVFFSTPVTIRVASTPMTLTAQFPGDLVKPGAKVDVQLTLTRLYGFTGPVTVVPVPDNALRIPTHELMIADNQTAGKFILDLNPKAEPGVHPLKLKIRMNFNGESVETEQVVEVHVGEKSK